MSKCKRFCLNSSVFFLLKHFRSRAPLLMFQKKILPEKLEATQSKLTLPISFLSALVLSMAWKKSFPDAKTKSIQVSVLLEIENLCNQKSIKNVLQEGSKVRHFCVNFYFFVGFAVRKEVRSKKSGNGLFLEIDMYSKPQN